MAGGQSPDELLASADAACYAAKDKGRDRVQLYAPGDSELIARRGEMLWAPEIIRALDEGRMRLYRQPIAPVSATADRRPHHEMLVRLVAADGQLVAPAAFIPAAERFGLMRRIDQWVVATTIEYLGARHAAAGADEPVELCSVNLSALSISDPLLAREIEQLLDEHNLPGAALCFEITETAAIGNLATARDLMKQLSARGCRFALDDLGQGLSSFAYLRELPVDVLKIEGSIVRDVADDAVCDAIVRAVHDVARSIGAETVAEFVEETASSIGCRRSASTTRRAMASPGPSHCSRRRDRDPAGRRCELSEQRCPAKRGRGRVLPGAWRYAGNI